MKISYYKFLKAVKKHYYNNINWLNKNKIKTFRNAWVYAIQQKNFSTSKFFFDSHKMLLHLGLRDENKTYRLNSYEYWLLRGWDYEFSREKVSALQKDNSKKTISKYNGLAPTTVEWLIKYRGLSEDEARSTVRNRKRGLGFLGYEKEEHIKISKKASLIAKEKMRKLLLSDPEAFYSKFSTRIEYYLAKGYDRKTAANLVKKRQSTFSKIKMIEKYGEETGLKLFNERQEKWLHTLSLKSDEEKQLINSKKKLTLENFERKHGATLGKLKYFRFLKYRRIATSKEAVDFFRNLTHAMFEENLDFEITWSRTNEHQNEFYLLSESGKPYFYDFTILSKKLIIEYNGEAFHPNKDKLSEIQWNNWRHPFNGKTADEVYRVTVDKLETAKKAGFEIIEVWSSEDLQESIKNIVKLIKNKK